VLDAEGWFHTGDLARCDEDEFFCIAGRSKDMIISGGVNIYPVEIEKELLDHPALPRPPSLRHPTRSGEKSQSPLLR
jgi:acyl-CoA synthetase (AMP-forming)/AMP-acid ligase II